MANVYLNLPAPAGNGAGAWVDVSAMGFEKTIVVNTLPTATVIIEMSNEAVASRAAPVCIITRTKKKQIVGCAALWMRARVSGYRGGGAPDVEVGANDNGAAALPLTVPAGSGTGAAVDTSSLGEVKTIVVNNQFSGLVIVEASEDNVSWAPVMTFNGPGQRSASFSAEFMRVTRSGVVGGTAPLVSVGAIIDVTPGPGFLNPVIFTYTVTGLEPDPTDFMVPLPAARADDDYLVIWSGNGMENLVAADFPDIVAGDRTNAAFRAVWSAPLTAGDVLTFLVANP